MTSTDSRRRPRAEQDAAPSAPLAATHAFSAGGHPLLDERVSFLVHRINAQLAQVCNRVFKILDVDLFSSRILVCLLERGDVRVGDLVETMVLPQSTISHQLQRLEKRRLVKRRRTRGDNRSVTVALTPLGARVAEECNALSLDVYQTMIRDIAPDDIRRLRRLLNQMFSSLTGLDADGLDREPAEPARRAESARKKALPATV